ncbi:MAG: iron chelate uptake ABC transporter family permease subunit [Syntrophales bacterium]|nr:iron chelate uptake ABC transporter family permease subunit [Syntrophales bacterium]
MIQEFVSSWHLFQHSYLAGWLIAILLSLIGVLVVARNQIFLGAAVSQASTLGIALAIWLGESLLPSALSELTGATLAPAMAVVFSVAAAILTTGRGEEGQETPEAVTGWVFLLSASGAILIVSHSPIGLDEVQRLLSSSIIGATAPDVWVFGGLAALTALFFGLFHQRLLLFSLDPAMAAAVGLNLAFWGLASSAWLGLAVGLSIRVSGMLYTFGCLVLPALIAKNLCREVRTMFLLSPVIALGTGIFGFILAHRFDFPPAQMTVALLNLFLCLTWIFRRYR